MSRARPRWSWVLVGPQQSPARELKRLPNIYLTGAEAHEDLPGYVRRFDVGIVPYRQNGYTATVVPTKVNEHLAMGKPVVSTNLPEVVSSNGGRDAVVLTCENRPGEFIDTSKGRSAPRATTRRPHCAGRPRPPTTGPRAPSG